MMSIPEPPEAPVMTIKERIEIYKDMVPTCVVNILGHGDNEMFDDLLQEYNANNIKLKAFFFSPVEQCLSNVSIKTDDQCSHAYSRWGKTKKFLSRFNDLANNPLYNIINNYNRETSGIQSFYVLTYNENTQILRNESYQKFSRQSQGHFKARTPVNQYINFDCISSINYVEYCSLLSDNPYKCPKNEFIL
jgi:hypothetical protein